ncbi:MAG TPA: PP2C family protein-serine/threonine phosphatase [Nocardioides sp.]|nr:PP2C family protein-serine/threonine phosphatase [Nocardioides sp.]
MTPKRSLKDKDLIIPLGVLGVLAGIDAALPPRLLVSGSFGVAAVVASAITTVRRTAMVGVAALVVTAISPIWNHDLNTIGWWIRLAMAVGLGALAVVLATVRVRREQALQHMTTIAETAQRALLRAIPSSIGSLRFATRYVSATKDALVGGDLYEVVEAPDGVRLIVGDARGKGLDAVQMAATVLATFRRAAALELPLTEIAADLDRVVTAVAGMEDFVTALLADLHDDHTVTLVNCGHHPPLLLTDAGTTALVDTGDPQPPLGLGPTPHMVTTHLPEGARMLFYTDGMIETRDQEGAFFPLTDRAHILLGGSLDDALDGLLGQVADHAAEEIDDDMALVLAERHTRRDAA